MRYDDAPATKRDLQIRKEELQRHFDVVAEQFKRDVLGAFRDLTVLQDNKCEDHDRRIQRLERHSGLVEA